MKNLEIYKKKILSYLKEEVSSKYFVNDGCIEIVQKNDSCELKVSINTTNHTIDNVKISILNEDKYLKGMMNAFYKIIIGLPILEANDHAIIKLENLLRDKKEVIPIKGIIMPTNSSSLFNIPLSLIRKVYTTYCNKQKYNPTANTFIPSKVKEWNTLDIIKKEKKLFKKIFDFCHRNEIIDYAINFTGDTRIEFFVDKTNYPQLGKLLLDMEIEIENHLGFSLEIMYVEKQDANRKRKKNYEK